MAEEETSEEDEDGPKKKSKLPLILGVVLAAVGGGGGFFAVSSGMILAPPPPEESEMAEGEEIEPTTAEAAAAAALAKPADDGPVAFVALDPLLIALAPAGASKVLRFTAQLEVTPDTQAEVEAMLPRIVDVLNSYLRAVALSDLQDPTALARLRGQMLRRVQVVAGPNMVRDLLIMEFVVT